MYVRDAAKTRRDFLLDIELCRLFENSSRSRGDLNRKNTVRPYSESMRDIAASRKSGTRNILIPTAPRNSRIYADLERHGLRQVRGEIRFGPREYTSIPSDRIRRVVYKVRPIPLPEKPRRRISLDDGNAAIRPYAHLSRLNTINPCTLVARQLRPFFTNF